MVEETGRGSGEEIAALTADLLFAARIRGAAAAAGAQVRLARSAAELESWVAEGSVGRVLVDLELRSADAIDLVRRLRSAGGSALEIVAYAPHVEGERIAGARAAGATRVLARSAFVRELPGLVTGR
jgi:DNA-binding response OmpR family regulator